MKESNMLLRWILVIFMAFFLAIMLDNPDRNVRLLAAVFLIIFAQIREISLVNDAGGSASKNEKKKEVKPKKQLKESKSPPSTKHQWDERDKEILRSFASTWKREKSRL